MLVQYNDQLIKRRVFLNNIGMSVLRLVLIRSTNLIWWTEESFWNQASTVQRKLRCLWSVRLLVCVSWLRLCLRLCWIPAFVVRLRRAVYLSLSDLMWVFLTLVSLFIPRDCPTDVIITVISGFDITRLISHCTDLVSFICRLLSTTKALCTVSTVITISWIQTVVLVNIQIFDHPVNHPF